MTINAPAAILLRLYCGCESRRRRRQTARNHPERYPEGVCGPRNLHIPTRAEHALDHGHHALLSAGSPQLNTISISGYHIREAGSTAAQEVGFTLANAIAYIEAAQAAGMVVDEFAPQLSFFFNAHNNFLKKSPNSERGGLRPHCERTLPTKSRNRKNCAIPRPPAPRSPRSSRKTTWRV